MHDSNVSYQSCSIYFLEFETFFYCGLHKLYDQMYFVVIEGHATYDFSYTFELQHIHKHIMRNHLTKQLSIRIRKTMTERTRRHKR